MDTNGELLKVSLDEGTWLSSSVGPYEGDKDGKLDGLLDVNSLVWEYQTAVGYPENGLDGVKYGYVLGTSNIYTEGYRDGILKVPTLG